MPIGTTNYPAALDTATTLFRTANNAATTLTGAHDAAVTTITVASTAAFPADGAITIDSEIIYYTAKTATEFTGCTRASDGTVADNHANGAAVQLRIISAQHTVLRDAIIAAQTKLGSGADTPAAGDFLKATGAGTSGWSALTTSEVTGVLAGATISGALTVTGQLTADTGGAATFVVAANNASTRIKAQADYVCDGTADQVEINAAIAALPLRGGKVVLSEGTFNIAGEIVLNRDGVTLQGMGYGVPAGDYAGGPSSSGTRLVLTSGFVGSYALDCSPDDGTRCLFGVTLADFNIQGFAYTATAVTGINHMVSRGTIRDVFVQYMSGHGLYSNAYDDPENPGLPIESEAPFDNFYTNVRIRDSALHGMFFENTSTDHIFVGCIIENSGQNGMQFGGTLGNATALQIHGCYIYSNLGRGISSTVGWQIKIFNTRIQDSGQGGIYIGTGTGTGSNWSIVGCTLRSNSISAENTYDEINISASTTSRGGIISDITFFTDLGLDNTLLRKARYGINIASANIVDAVIGPCSYGYHGAAGVFGTGFISDSGTNTRILTADQMKLVDGATIQVGTTTGTKIGTSASQKLGFFNATPVVQPASGSDLRSAMINLGLHAGGVTPLDLNGGTLTTASFFLTKDAGIASMQQTAYGSGNYSYVLGRMARGTLAAPLRTKSGDTLVRLAGMGAYAADDTSAATFDTAPRARLTAYASEDWTSTGQGAFWAVETTNSTQTTVTERLRLGRNGDGIDFSGSTQATYQIRYKNNGANVGRNAANSADINLFKINTSDQFELQADTKITDAKNIVLDTTTGTKFGTATTQKLGFFNATPIVQPAGTTDLRAAMISLGLLASGGATPLDLNGGAFTTTGAATVGTLNTHTIPAGTDTFVMRNTTDTLTNKTLTAPTINTTLTMAAGAYMVQAGIAGNPASPVAGDKWYNTTQKAHRFQSTAGTQGLVGLLFAATSTSTVATTASETNFAQNYTLPADSLTVGKTIRVRARGVYGNTATPTLILRVKLGAVVLGSTGTYTTITGMANRGWEIEFLFTVVTVGATGTVEGQGFATLSNNTSGTTAATLDMENTAAITVNTTGTNVVQVSAQWGTSNASNTITQRMLTIEALD